MTSASNWASRPSWGHPTVTAHTSLTTLGKICQVSYRLPKQTADTDPTTHRAPALKTESQQSRGQCCFSLSVRSTREGNIVYVDIDYESRQPIHTPAYHTSEQSTLQTPDSLCLDPHTTLANTYDDFRVTTYNLRLMTSQLCFTGTHHHQQPTTTSSLSLSSIARYDLLRLDLRSTDRYDLRLTTS